MSLEESVNRSLGRSGILLVALAGLAVARPASAAGVRVGDGRLVPRLQLEGRYDSFVGVAGWSRASQVANPDDIIFHVRPGLGLTVPSDRVAVAIDGEVDYHRYLGITDPGTREASFLGVSEQLSLGFNRKGHVGFEVGQSFARSDRLNTLAIGIGTRSNLLNVGGRLLVRPGGQALEGYVGYAFGFELFDRLETVRPADCAEGDANCHSLFVDDYDYQNHRLIAGAQWRFFPKTALVLEGQMDMRRYDSEFSPEVPGKRINVNANPLLVTFGLIGLVAPHVGVSLKAGYGDSLIRENGARLGGNFASPIGQAELSYLMSDTTRARVGYLRQVQPVSGPSGFYSDDRVYASVEALAAGRLALTGGVSYDHTKFGQLTGVGAPSAPDRTDDVLSAHADTDYRWARWFRSGIGYVYSTRESRQTGALSSAFDGDYDRHEAYLRLTLEY